MEAPLSLDTLGQMIQQVLDGQRRHDTEFHDLKLRLSAIEGAIGRPPHQLSDRDTGEG